MEPEVVPIMVSANGYCTCSCGDPCPLGKWGMEMKCTVEQLKQAGVKTVLIPLTTKHERKSNGEML